METLFLTSRLPFPPNRGDKLRVFNFLKNLSRAGQIIHLLSFIGSEKEQEYLIELHKFCEKIVTVLLPPLASNLKAVFGLLDKIPLQVSYYRSNKMFREVKRMMDENKYDVIYVHLFRMAPYVLNCKNVYKIVDLTDVVSKEIELSISHRSGIKKWIYNVEFPRIRSYETKISSEFDETWVISKHEAELLRKYSPYSKIEVVPNGVDIDYFKPLNLEEDPYRLIFVGNLQIDHNIDAILYFYKEIFPVVRRKIPQTKFYIVGASPDHRLSNLARDKNVIITGLVDDLNLYLNQANIFVAPLRFSAGVQNKILEAMSAGLPVVCSDLANQGIKATPEREILIANNSLHFAEQLLYLLKNHERCKVIGLSAREFVKRNFKWETVVERFQVSEERVRKITR
ncbi:MAG TPA: TIGR03087 family PEP-CTERM/XrtA system glycosyltransferase [Terriglobales bacterium]|nr:TIGR03087 family PEP-CTERM/XrtA system glycosyltransferase [Terriglobales bacterium]